MANYYKPIDQFKNYDYYLPQRIGPGALPNDQIRKCYKCNGPIQFRKRPDGTYQLLDYFTGQQHVHRVEVQGRN
jgi:hypothetical protein